MKCATIFLSILLIPAFVLAHEEEEYIFVVPDSLVYEAGTEVTAEVRIHAPESTTSFRVLLQYDPELLEIREIKPNAEAFPFWWPQEVINGFIELQASTPSPGVEGEILAAEITVMAKQAGSGLFEVDETDSLLLNAQDENILDAERRLEAGPETESAPLAASGLPSGAILALVVLLLGGVAVGAVAFLRGQKK